MSLGWDKEIYPGHSGDNKKCEGAASHYENDIKTTKGSSVLDNIKKSLEWVSVIKVDSRGNCKDENPTFKSLVQGPQLRKKMAIISKFQSAENWNDLLVKHYSA